jgi:sulfate/thiosulfate transport system permease protein
VAEVREKGRVRFAERTILPGLGPSLGFTLFYLGLVVLLPLGGLLLRAAGVSGEHFVSTVTSPRALASYRLSFGAALAGGATNAVFGLITAWVLVRYRFPGRRFLDALVDLPFALPTAVAGIALTTAWAPGGLLGRPLARLGIAAAYNPLGVVVALTFIGLPFVVRTVQPVLEDIERDSEEAAAVLGASRLQTFLRVTFPALAPALLTGFSLAVARGIGEYGSVVFISGNMPMRTEITPLLVMTKLEQYDYAGATALAVVMLGVSFLMLLTINLLQRWQRRAA